MQGSGKTPPGGGSGTDPGTDRRSEREEPLYFFPDQEVTLGQLREVLEQGSRERRAWAISHMLRYAVWDDIWAYVSREEVREIFPALELPDNLRQAWGRMLKVESESPVA
jgi:hypothetical protein